MKALSLFLILCGLGLVSTIFCPAYWGNAKSQGLPMWPLAWILGWTELAIGVSLWKGKL